MTNTELRPVEFGTFEFSAKVSLDELYKIIREDSSGRAYVYLLTTDKPVRYDRGSSRILYIGKAHKTWSEGLTEFAIRLGRLCDPEYYKTFRCDSATWESLRRRGNRYGLYLLQSSPSRVEDLERTLFKEFKLRHGRLPLQNIRDGTPKQEVPGAEEVIKQFAGGE
jgi:hypothetical protein